MIHNYTVMDPHCKMDVDQCELIRTIKKVIFGTTIVADVITLFVLVLFRKYQTFSQRIFLNIMLANIIKGIGHIMDDGIEHHMCLVAGFLVQTFGFALFLWVSGLTLFLFLLIVKESETQIYESRYMAVCWGIPLILGCIPLFTDTYGPAGAYCWVRNNDIGSYLRFIIWWIPVMVGIVLIFLAFVIMYCKTSQSSLTEMSITQKQRQKKLAVKYLRPLTGYAASFVVFHVIMFIDRVITVNGEPIYEMRVLQIIAISSYGLILCTLFYLTNGRGDFTMDKLRLALEEHKIHFCRKKSRITAFDVLPFTTIHSATQVSTSKQTFTIKNSLTLSFIDKQRMRTNDDGIILNPSNISKDNATSTTIYTHDRMKPESSDSRCDQPYPNRHEKQDRPNHSDSNPGSDLELPDLTSLVEEPKPLIKRGSWGFILQPQNGEDLPAENSTDERTDMTMRSVNHEYEMKSSCDLVQISVNEEYTWYENWSDAETVDTLVTRLHKHVPKEAVIQIRDKNGVYFGGSATLKQIKCVSSSVEILINSRTTRVKFMKDESRDV